MLLKDIRRKRQKGHVTSDVQYSESAFDFLAEILVQSRRRKMTLEIADVTCDVHAAYRFLNLREQNHNEFLFEAKSRKEFN